jgi:O-antigen ligase
MVESFVGFALLGFVGRKLIKPDFSFLKFLPNLFLLFFLVFNAASLLNSGEFLHISLRALSGKWLQYIAIYVIIQDSILTSKIFKRAIQVFLTGSFLAMISGLSQYFFNTEFLRGKSIAAVHGGICAITSSFNHYNDFGGYLVVVLGMLFALLLARDCFDFKTNVLSVFTVITVISIILTFSRGSWLAIIIATVFVVLLSKRFKKAMILVFLLITSFLLVPLVRGRLLFIFQSGGDSNRFLIWSAIIKMIEDHPFLGMGVGTFMANFCSYLPDLSPYYAHNCYLQIWAETGIFSLVNFLAFIVSIVYLASKKFIFTQDFILLGLLSGIIGFLTHSFFDTNLYSLRLAILFWIWNAFLAVKIREKNSFL